MGEREQHRLAAESFEGGYFLPSVCRGVRLPVEVILSCFTGELVTGIECVLGREKIGVRGAGGVPGGTLMVWESWPQDWTVVLSCCWCHQHAHSALREDGRGSSELSR